MTHASKLKSPEGVEVVGEMGPRFDEILTRDALAFRLDAAYRNNAGIPALERKVGASLLEQLPADAFLVASFNAEFELAPI